MIAEIKILERGEEFLLKKCEPGVAPTRRGHGLGKKLLAALLDVARDLGCSEAWVLTDRSNSDAMRLYKSVGGEAAPTDQVMFTFLLEPK